MLKKREMAVQPPSIAESFWEHKYRQLGPSNDRSSIKNHKISATNVGPCSIQYKK
jgi:hypothetical protein